MNSVEAPFLLGAELELRRSASGAHSAEEQSHIHCPRIDVVHADAAAIPPRGHAFGARYPVGMNGALRQRHSQDQFRLDRFDLAERAPETSCHARSNMRRRGILWQGHADEARYR